MPQDLGELKLKAGQTVLVTGPSPMEAHVDKRTKTRARVTAPGTYVDPTPPPPVEPPPVTPTPGIFGGGVASDGKDNAEIGRSDSQHWGIVWDSQGGPIVSLGVCWRSGPDAALGMGYSAGDGGDYRISLQGTKADGMPDGVIISERTFKPGNTHSNSESRVPVPISATAPKGRLAWVFDNIHADPVRNWTSLNFLVYPGGPQPGTTAIVAFKGNASGGQWRNEANNTPTFQVRFADGHAEGQGYGSIIADTDMDGPGPDTGNDGLTVKGVIKVRQRLLAPRDLIITAIALRAKRLSGSGMLFGSIGAIAGQASVDFIPVTAKDDLNGGRWIEVPFASPATVKAGTLFLPTFSTNAILDVMPIRKDGYGQDGWIIPENGGYAEKALNGSSWEEMYSDETDLQMYCRVAG